MTVLLGIAANVILAVCGIPQAVRAIKDGHARGVSLWTSITLVLGLSMLSAYVALKFGFDLVLHLQYSISILTWLIVLRYSIWERK